MYSLHFYGEIMADPLRTDPHVEALRRTVNPDSVVLDLGCGPGLFALVACKLGARRVYGIEPDNAINIAREAAVANGFADRMDFYQDVSTRVSLPEPATIIIFDLRGVMPWFTQNIPSIVDARQRLLAPGGLLIPRRDLAWATIVEDEQQYEQIVGAWGHKYVDLSAGRSRITNCWRKTRVKPDSFLVEPVCWATLDYREVTSPSVRADISWRAARPGVAHGIALWFDAELADGIGFTNHPAAPELVYSNGFLPFSQPVKLSEGESISVRLSVDHVQNDYVWSWTTDFTDQQLHFEQSTFYGVPLSPEQLRQKYGQRS
jgi:protein arginine N-methyltransferase 1